MLINNSLAEPIGRRSLVKAIWNHPANHGRRLREELERAQQIFAETILHQLFALSPNNL